MNKAESGAERFEPPMIVTCPTCDGPVMGTRRGEARHYDPEEGPPERWTLLQCPAGHTLLVVQNEFSGVAFDDDAPYRVFPPQDRTLRHEIPEALRNAHTEARKCFRAQAWIGTVAMCGRTLEGACKLHGVTKGDLRDKLEKMKDQGLIDGRLWEWAETLRGARNAASHFDAQQAATREDAEDALAYSEALLDYLYVLKARFDAMKARRSP